MSTYRILDYPDPRLKTVAQKVDDINAPHVQEMIHNMLETLENTDHCGGLAATQLDIEKPLRIFVYYDYENDDPSNQVARVIVNPEIVKTEGEVNEQEGCMSVYPDHIHAAVKRPALTTMKALNEKGETIELARGGYLAKLFIHEVDHLEGKVYIDHLKPLKRAMLDKKIAKLRKNLASNSCGDAHCHHDH
ncbi:MAG: peptide deformylase [Gammaproteobacteria bacterium CG11_big_fil_rev_8_21_14_0_20_46_22]|nr:MAG: peptide deformylase [Gammaproteobacteria bacterium CG12_big_fil_rev_8_21_14_0_65_46_12]PIR11291.1 MAG: peptide deformylase [Gammaproteobacteria bacterium CG11_big_fil_rev_8_21_14_0_20_46_22]